MNNFRFIKGRHYSTLTFSCTKIKKEHNGYFGFEKNVSFQTAILHTTTLYIRIFTPTTMVAKCKSMNRKKRVSRNRETLFFCEIGEVVQQRTNLHHFLFKLISVVFAFVSDFCAVIGNGG